MTKESFFTYFDSPLPRAILKKYPAGNIMQYWAESPGLYSTAFGKGDDMHKFVCGHSGIDIATFEGDEVCAAHDGTVYKVVKNQTGLGGNYVELRSPTYTEKERSEFCITAYGHLGQISVEEGQQVYRGQKIGSESNTGFIVSDNIPYWGNAPAGKGVHLHFSLTEFRVDGNTNVPLYPNCLGNTSDPILRLTGDSSGLQILLANMASLLRYWNSKYFGR